MRSLETAAPLQGASVRQVNKISFDQSVLDGYADFIFAPGGPRAIRVVEVGGQARPISMVVVARHEDVTTVLTNESVFSLSHYAELFSAISPPGSCLYMHSPSPERTQRGEILKAATARTPWFQPDGVAIRQLARKTIDGVLKSYRARATPAFDIIGEYGYFAPYKIACSALGLPGPRRHGPLEWLFTEAKCFPITGPSLPRRRRTLRNSFGPNWFSPSCSQISRTAAGSCAALDSGPSGNSAPTSSRK